ncbi:hypothetical protein PAXINDRAFT_85460 [Paxillus involutus ATCC 200175]|uniref:WD40 repeat-like protein n=1 Tax=Paxillus involutus ATCC 200175 TaxID=664439 RepID=A0A0C9TU87_PAXIN|nr:hypothetical protein PAXINDRAFT_85460 [Paxillus involutus ATCC 200175]
MEDGCEIGKALWESGIVYAVAASGDGRWIATGGVGKNVTIWNTTTYEKVIELEGHSGDVRSLAFSRDSARIVSGSEDKTVIVWSATTGERHLGPLKGHTYTVWCARFSPDDDKIASCDGSSIRVWNSHSGVPLMRPIHVSAIALEWTPDDSQQLIAGCVDGFIRRFSSSTGSLLADWEAHTALITSIAVSQNGKFIASASHDKTVRICDMTTSTQIGPTLQCDDKVYSVAISPAGRHLVSAGRGHRVRI